MRRGLQSVGKVKRVLLLRHASHASSQDRTFIGSTDLSLSEPGRREASSLRTLIESWRPERCLSSPLRRCRETVELASRIPAETLPDLREIDFGLWEGKTFDEIRLVDPDLVDRWARFDPEFGFPGGERLADFGARIRRVAGLIAASPEKTVLVVTHGGVIRALICHFLGLELRQYLLFNIDCASLAIVDLFGDRGVLAGLNCGPHQERV